MQTPNLQVPTTTLYVLYTLNEPFSFKLKKITVSHVSDPLKIWRPRELLVWFLCAWLHDQQNWESQLHLMVRENPGFYPGISAKIITIADSLFYEYNNSFYTITEIPWQV